MDGSLSDELKAFYNDHLLDSARYALSQMTFSRFMGQPPSDEQIEHMRRWRVKSLRLRVKRERRKIKGRAKEGHDDSW